MITPSNKRWSSGTGPGGRLYALDGCVSTHTVRNLVSYDENFGSLENFACSMAVGVESVF